MRSLKARSIQTMLLLDSEIALEFLKISFGSGAVVPSEYTTIYRYVWRSAIRLSSNLP